MIPENVNPTSLEFLSLVWKRLPGSRPLIVLPVIIGLLFGLIGGLVINSVGGLFMAVFTFGLSAGGTWYYITSTALRRVLLLERDDSEPGWHWRYWWRTDESKFADSWRFTFGRSRLLVLDLLGNEPVAFNPFMRPLSLPANQDDFVTPEDFGQVAKEARAVGEILKLPSNKQEAIQTGLLVAALLGALFIGFVAMNAGLDRLQGP